MISVRGFGTFIAASVLFVAMVWATGAHAQGQSPLVDPAWLVERLDNPSIVVLDLRRKAAYDDGHITGAINLDPTTVAFRRRTADGLIRLPTPEEFAAQMGALGIRATDRIVLLSAGQSWLDVAGATDLFWLLKRFGHAEVAILNGGFRRLSEAVGVRVDRMPVARPATTYIVGPALVSRVPLSVMVTGRVGVTLVDACLRAQYLGINKTAVVSRYGTIPGAKNLPGNWVTHDAGGRFRTDEDLRQVLDLAGIPEEGPTVVFGNTALAGSLVWFALRVVLGNREVRLYDGGFREWVGDPGRPVTVFLDSGETQRP
jgi:thiosulfate/3-mercaptopyruvate sulfurtransferase